MNGAPQSPTLDSVKSFSEYANIGLTLAYQYTRAKGFPVIQLKKGGRIWIEREAALDWMREHTTKKQYYEFNTNLS